MSTKTRYTYMRGNGGELQELFGLLPGKLTTHWLKRGWNEKWTFWLADEKKWHQVREGDVFELTSDGPRLVR